VALALKRQGITDVRPLAGGLQGWLERGYPADARMDLAKQSK